MADRELTIRITLDAQGAVTGLNGIDGALNNAMKAAENFSGSSVTLERSLSIMTKGLSLAQSAVSGISRAFGTFSEALSRGAAVDDVASSFAKLSEQGGILADTFLNQLVTATGETISNFDLQKQAIETVRAGAKPDEFVELTKAARAMAEQTGGSTKDALNQLTQAFETGRVQSLKNALGIIDVKKAEDDLAKQLGFTREELNEEGKVLAARNALLEASRKKTEEVGEITADAGDAIDKFNAVVKNTKDKFFNAIAKNKELNKTLGELADAIKAADFTQLVDGMNFFIKEVIKGTKELLRLIDALRNLLDPTRKYFKELELLLQAQKASSEAVQLGAKIGLEAGIATNKVSDALKTNKDRLRDQEAAARKAEEALKKLADEQEKLAQRPIFGPGNDEGYSKYAQEITKAIEKAKEDAARKLQEQEDLYQQAGADLILSFYAGIQDGLDREDVRPLITQTADTLATAFGADPITAALIHVGADLVGKFFEGLGSDSAGTKAKKAADKFFADAFDVNRLSVIVDGQLKRITDLVFSGDTPFGGNVEFGGSGFDAFFQTLDQTAQNSFSNIGLAFATMLGDIEKLGTTLGPVLANNLGGSLNNLQLLIQATGVSAQQLQDSIVNAFLNGELSALEAQGAIQDLQTIMQEGIPDAVGAVETAFENLKAAGVEGGRASVDALKDLGAEAKELGAKTLKELFDRLVASGKFTAEEISKVQESLAAFGIDTLDELSSLSNETALAILANLQANNFPFAEVQGEIDKLKEKLNEIPQNIVRNIEFRVKVTGDPIPAVYDGVSISNG